MKTIVFLGLALLVLGAVAQSNTTNTTNTTTENPTPLCDKGSDEKCASLGTEWCCAYEKANGVEMHSCGRPDVFETARTFAEAAGIEDYEVYCDNAIFAKISAVVLALFAVAQLF